MRFESDKKESLIPIKKFGSNLNKILSFDREFYKSLVNYFLSNYYHNLNLIK